MCIIILLSINGWLGSMFLLLCGMDVGASCAWPTCRGVGGRYSSHIVRICWKYIFQGKPWYYLSMISEFWGNWRYGRYVVIFCWAWWLYMHRKTMRWNSRGSKLFLALFLHCIWIKKVQSNLFESMKYILGTAKDSGVVRVDWSRVWCLIV